MPKYKSYQLWRLTKDPDKQGMAPRCISFRSSCKIYSNTQNHNQYKLMKKQVLKSLWVCCLFLLVSLASFAQKKTISGKITDQNGTPIPGVTVQLKGASSGQIADAQGNYAITVNNSQTDKLIFSMVGFASAELSIANGTVLDVKLTEDNTQLNEVVVVGYGTQRRKDLTGSVASVKGDAFKNQPITNATEALQGRIAGVNIVKNSGAPDASPTIIIRGVSSLNQPNPLYIVDGVRVTDISNINIQDIETMDVLKDAAAASIYGASAAGGVVLVTTRKGTTAAPKFNYNYRFGVTTPKVGELLDKDGYIRLQNIINPGRFTNAPRLDTLANTDWIDETFKNAKEQNHNFSFTGAAPIVDYLVSGFLNKQEGVARKNYSDIGGGRLNTNFKIGNWLKFGEQLSVSRRTTSNPQNVGIEAQLHNAPFRTIPIIPVFNSNGSYGTAPTGYGFAFAGTHPVGAIDNANVENFKNNFQGNIYAEVKLPLDLTFRSNVGYTFYDESQNYFQNAFSIGGVGAGKNSLNKLSVESQSLLTNYILTYNKSVGKHNINAIAGFEQITGRYNDSNVTATDVSADAGKEYSLITTANTTYFFTGRKDNNALVKSLFGRLNYNYNSKYYLSASVREDANFTVFGPKKQRGVFPSVSGAWNISEESFFKEAIPAINTLKLRASYGELGNSNIGTYSFLSLYQTYFGLGNGSAGGANFAPGGTIIPGVTYSGIPNPELHWETVQETNIGLDGELMNNKLYFSLEYYNKYTYDMLYAMPLAPSAGISGDYLTNIGTVNNRGMELLLGYRSKIRDFGFDVSLTGAWNKNEVTKLTSETSSEKLDGYNYYNNGDVAFQMMPNQTITVTRKGLPFGSFYGYKVQGIFQNDADAAKQKVAGIPAHAGDLHFQDLNGDGEITDKDRQVIGNPNPKLVYGANIRLNFKGFDAAFLFHGVAGVELFNGVKAYEMRPFADGNA